MPHDRLLFWNQAIIARRPPMMQTGRTPGAGHGRASGAIRHWLPLLLLLAAMAVPLGARAEDPAVRQFANLIFTPPPDWQWIGRQADGRLRIDYDGDDDRCRKCQILIDRGNSTAMPIRAWQEALSRTFFEGTVPASPNQWDWEANGGRPIHALMRVARDDRGRNSFQAFFAVGLPTRHELLAFTAEVSSQTELDGAVAVVNADILPMIERMRYESEGAAPVAGPPVLGTLRGPWYGTAVYNRYNGLSGTLELVRDTELFTFFPGGRFYRGMPPSGTAPINYQALVRSGELGLGNYRVAGNQVLLHYSDGNTTTLSFDGNAITSGRVTMRPATVPPPGYRFAGTIESASYTSFGLGSGMTGGVASAHTQVFRMDGTVIDSSFVGVTGSFDDGGGFTGTTEDPAAVGRYEVQQGRIVIIPPKGDPISSWIILDAGQSLVIGDEPVSRQ
jgi:hypothetical protein